MFKTQYSMNRISSEPGSPFLDKYSLEVDKKGRSDLKIVGRTNLYDLIQAERDSVDINNIIARYSAGDMSAIDRVRGMYIDATGMPSNYAELLNRKIQCEELFSQLPVDIKQQFDNSSDVFWSTCGDQHWLDVMGLSSVSDQSIVVDDVLKEVSDNVESE